VLAVLTASYVVNYLDRYVLSMLAGPVKEEFGISDAAMGLLLGPAFALFYSSLAVPMAWLADRHSRRGLIAAGMVVWSAFTALTGFAQSSLHVAIARIGVGVGESAGAAPAHSLLVDYFPPERRATALSILQMGITIGQMLGTLIGGLLVVPLGWRNVFIAVGLPGIVVALAVRLTVREPVRTLPAPRIGSLRGEREAFARSVAVLARIRTFVWIALGGMIAASAGTGFGFWVPQLFARSHGMSLAEFGLSFGIVNGVAGILGLLVSGTLADRLARFDPRWRLRIAAASVTFSMPILIAICAVPNPYVAVWLSVPSALVGAGYAPVIYAIAQSLSPPHSRSVTASVMMLCIGGGGMLIGPTAIGALSDALAPRFGIESLRVAMIAVLASMAFASVALLFATRTLARDLANAEAASGA
jgi:MFS transporter, Spinster family, sphingosine-1-phosphate transporter